MPQCQSKPWAVISSTNNQTIIRFKTYWDALQYAAIANQHSQDAKYDVRFLKS